MLKPRNLEVFRSTLAAREMVDQAEAFQHASGRFAWLFYKEDIETALRTPHFGGVQLLQLHDFPGQGEALIGLLDSFWDSKGILTPAEFRRFFSRTVPLLRMPKRVWTNQETFTATAQVAHYGIQVLRGASGSWSARDDAGRERGAGRFAARDVPLGSVTTLGEIRMPLAGISQAARLKVTMQVEGAAARNDWDIWVYPAQAAEPSPDALVTGVFDDAARRKLQDGGKVVLFWPRDASNDHTLATQFQPVFWSLTYFPKQSGVMGILCDPKHAALADFPTDGHSNWQWWELMEGSRAFVLDDAPAGLRPIVQVIDDYHRNHRLGAVFEARVGGGRLLVCSLDVERDLDSRPVARQLRRSLLAYVASAAFHPSQELPVELLSKMLGR